MSRVKIFSQKPPTHFILFSGIFISIIFFFIFFLIFFKTANAVIYDPKDNLYHTTIIYYDGNFSNRLIREDIQTGLYFLNLSPENVRADIYEYDRFGLEKKEMKNQILSFSVFA